jgi:glutamine amidotransferase
MCRHTEEGDTECLGIFDSDVKLFPPVDKIPHMGWNNFLSMKGDLFNGITLEDNLYYVHSYYAEISSCTSATCDYILPFSASMHCENFYATQFHPEKSAAVGEKILQNFLNL